MSREANLADGHRRSALSSIVFSPLVGLRRAASREMRNAGGIGNAGEMRSAFVQMVRLTGVDEGEANAGIKTWGNYMIDAPQRNM